MRRSRIEVYQAWSAPQCGQATVVETDAANTNPHAHVYEALSIGPPASRARARAASRTGAGGAADDVAVGADGVAGAGEVMGAGEVPGAGRVAGGGAAIHLRPRRRACRDRFGSAWGRRCSSAAALMTIYP